MLFLRRQSHVLRSDGVDGCAQVQRFDGEADRLLLLRDSDRLSHPNYGATRLKAALESALGERIWLLQPTNGGAAGFDGQYEVLDLPMARGGSG